MVVCVAFLCVVGANASIIADFQDTATCDFDFSTSLSYPTSSETATGFPYTETKLMRLYGIAGSYAADTPGSMFFITSASIRSDYFAFTLNNQTQFWTNFELKDAEGAYVTAYDVSSAVILHAGSLTLFTSYENNNRWECIRYSNTLYVYADGVLISSGACASQPYRWGFTYYTDPHAGYPSYDRYMQVDIDDVVISPAATIGGVIGTIPRDNYVKKDIVAPGNSGLINFDGTLIRGSEMYTRYSYTTGGTPLSGTGTITVTNARTDATADTYTISSFDPASGFYTLNLTTFISSYPTGRYKVNLFKDGSLVNSSKFMYIESGGSISWHKTIYNTGDTAYITSSISSYDDATYYYYGKIYSDADSLVESYTISSATQIQPLTIDSSKYSSGEYYVELVKTTKSGGVSTTIGYAFTNVTAVADTFSLTGGDAYTFQDNQSAVFYSLSGSGVTLCTGSSYTHNQYVYGTPYIDNFIYRLYGYSVITCTGPVGYSCYATDITSSPFTYYAFTLLSGSWVTDSLTISVLNSGGSVITTTGNLQSYVASYNSYDRWEVFVYGTTLYTYANGGLLNSVSGVSTIPYGIRFNSVWNGGGMHNGGYLLYFDDVERKSPYGGGVIATIPQDWYVYKDFTDPALSGVVCSSNGTLMSGDEFTTSYAIGSNMDGYTSGMTITTEHLVTGTVVNTTTKTTAEIASAPCGIIRYSSKNMLINSSAPFGVYKQTLKHGTQTIGYTTFAYISGGGTIYWDRNEYNADDIANITSSIGASFDTGTYNYYGRIYDIYGQLKHSWTISLASDIEQVELDPDTFPNGFYYVYLVAERKSDSEEFVMSYDIAEVIESVIVTGYTWDAVAGTKLGSTNVGTYQLGSWSNTTSDVTTALYQVAELISNAEIMFNASKVGYNHTPIYVTPLTAKTYNIDLYLIPVPITFNGSGIGGLALTSSYKQAVEGATITLSNSTWSGTRTTSSTGWYLFDSSSLPSGGYESSITEVVDNTYDMGMYSSITANGSMMHIAYYDNTNKEVISAYKDTSWHPEIADNGTVTTLQDCVYVADTGNHRIVQRDQDLIYINKIGSEGTGDDEFNGTVGLTTLRNYTVLSNYLYIADTNNHRVERRFANNLTFVDAFGTYGTGDDNFSSPQDVCVDGSGIYMWVADTGNHRIVQRFAENYTYVNQYGTYGTGTTNFSSPQGIGTEATGTYLLVTDTGNHRIMKLFAQNLTYIASVGSSGTNNNQFSSPRSATIERSGVDVFYVADTGNNRIMARKLSDLTYIRKIGSSGTGVDQFSAPKDITTDGVYLYVADSGNNRVHKRYASDLSYISMIGTSGSGDDQFSNPSGITVSLNGSSTVDYNVGEYISSTVDTSGNEWISYYDSSNADLMVAHRNYDGDWHTHRVDTTGDVGKYTGVANYNDVFHVSYYNTTGQTLKYAYGNETGYTVETADSTTGVGTYTAIVMTGGGEPRISYYDATNGDLKYAYKDIFGWSNTTVDSLENVGQYTDIAIDTSGYCHISYYDITNANLKYAYRDSTGWNTVSVDTTGDVGKYTSITRSDTTGYVYISYYDATNGDLKLAYYNTSAWSIVTLDSTGDVGKYTSITLDASGYPHISYYDATNQQLKHIYYYLSTTTTNDLAPLTTYTITAAKTGYMTNTSSVVAPTYGNYTLFDILMQGYYTLTVNVKDASTNTLITSGLTVTLSDGQTFNTTTGQAQFQAVYGAYTVGASGTGYYYSSTSVLLDANKEVTIYMNEMPDYASTIDYTIAPRNVRFICVDHFGQRLNDVSVSAVGYSTTLPDWGILNVVFGWLTSYTNSSVTNDTMRGTTGDDGSVVFLMTESLQYQMSFVESSRGINETLTLYPKDDSYVITLGSSPFEEPAIQHINITMYTTEPNSTATTLWAYYNDPNAHTTSANFTVRNASGYLLYSHVTSGSNTFTDSYTVSHVTGTQYTWGILAQQTDYGSVSRYASTTLHSRLIELGLEDMYYNWISLIFLFILIGLFSGRSVIYGYVVFPLIAGLFYFIGWLDVGYILISGVIILGLMLFLSKKQFQGEGV